MRRYSASNENTEGIEQILLVLLTPQTKSEEKSSIRLKRNLRASMRQTH